jgi:hypothetical protein
VELGNIRLRIRLINFDIRAYIMHKIVVAIRALIGGRASINYVGKTPISRTPGNVTQELAHN